MSQWFLVGCMMTILPGCTSQLAEFRTWLDAELASKGPFKIEALTLQSHKPDGKPEDFDFHGKLVVTEDLYRRVPVVDDVKLKDLRMRAKVAGLSPEDILKLEAPLASVRDISFCELLSKKGTTVSFSGKAKAHPGGRGNFELLELQGLDILRGERLKEGWVDRSADNGGKLLLEAESESSSALKSFEDAIVSRELVQSEKAVKKQSLLAACQPGKKRLGVWETGGFQGALGIEFTKQGAEADGFPVEGFLFDPQVSEYRKPFRGRIEESGNANDPFELRLVVEAENGGVVVHDEILHARAKAEQAGLVNKTMGLLLVQCNYTFILTPSANGVLAGRILEDDVSNRLWTLGSTPTLEFPPHAPPPRRTSAQSGTTELTTIQSATVGNGAGARPIPPVPPPSPQAAREKRLIQLAVDAEPMAHKFTEAVSAGDSAKANEIFQQMVRKYPEAPQTLALRISHAQSLGNTQMARQLYETLKSYPLPESNKQEVEQLGKRINQKK